MDASFWHDRWQAKEIGFHQRKGNSLLAKYVNELGLKPGNRVFVPLCGKTVDIAWLMSEGYRVVGIELSDIAVGELFESLDIEPQKSASGNLTHCRAENLDIFIGDFFDLSSDILDTVDAVYDRAALVALPEPLRTQYANHLLEVTANAPQLLLCFEYNQDDMPGPPFSITGDAISRLYSEPYEITQLASEDVRGGLKGICQAQETVSLLQPREPA